MTLLALTIGFCIIAALGFAKSRFGEAGLKDLALVNVASSP